MAQSVDFHSQDDVLLPGLQGRQITLVDVVAPETLDMSNSNSLWQMKLVRQEQHGRIAPSVATDPSAPMDRTDLAGPNIPCVVLGVAVGVLPAVSVLRPVRDLLLIEQGLLTNHKTKLPRLHVLFDCLHH